MWYGYYNNVVAYNVVVGLWDMLDSRCQLGAQDTECVSINGTDTTLWDTLHITCIHSKHKVYKTKNVYKIQQSTQNKVYSILINYINS